MKLADVREPILRRYLEVTFGGAPETAAAVDGATFDEFLALRRIRFPDAAAQTAVRNAPTRELRDAGALRGQPPPASKPPLRRFVEVKGRPRLNLRDRALAADVQVLSLKGIRAITDWDGLRRFMDLEDLNLVACDDAGDPPADAPIALRHLQLHSCGIRCTRAALATVRATEIMVDAEVFDARLLGGQAGLMAVHISAGHVSNVGALGILPIVQLGLGWVQPGATLTKLLQDVSRTVTVVSLRGARPLGPDVLPDLPALERLTVPGDLEYRDAWITWALAHRNVATQFTSVLPPPRGMSLAEVHHGVEILEIAKGKTARFEVQGDFAFEMGFDGSNGDLEDELSAGAKRARKRITWSSEADTFVAQTTDLGTARWIVEQLVERGLPTTSRERK